ncbi:hypothetical protein [Arvimicrobium flavum]|uniref:hypothetical protein n=1 Tax=Arvimicrobium flavum TaxID=3393320 RepID=UPI00237A4CDA|nr:hypothetical protein [Mesorhizobium shangrilense]
MTSITKFAGSITSPFDQLLHAAAEGERATADVEAAAAALAAAMQALHGGRFRIQIDHLNAFALIVKGSPA